MVSMKMSVLSGRYALSFLRNRAELLPKCTSSHPMAEQILIFKRIWKKSAKATLSLVLSVCPSACLSVRMEQLGSHWTDIN